MIDRFKITKILLLQKSVIISVVLKFISVFVSLYIIRWLNVEMSISEYKDFNVVTSFTPVIIGIITFGIPQILYKEYTNSKEQKLTNLWTAMFVLRWISYVIGLLICFIFFNLTGLKDALIVSLIYTAQFIVIADIGFRSILDARNKSWRFSATDLLGKILLVIILASSKYLFIETNKLYLYAWASIAVYFIIYTLDFIINSDLIGFSKIDFKVSPSI